MPSAATRRSHALRLWDCVGEIPHGHSGVSKGPSNPVQRLTQIGDQIVDVFQPHVQANALLARRCARLA